MTHTPYTVPPLDAAALQGGGFQPTLPPDKSLSHRALLFAGLTAEGGRIENCLASEDCLSTLGILQALGTRAERLPPGPGSSPSAMTVIINGPGLFGWRRDPGESLDAGNSGTTARLMTGVLAGANVYAVMTGDASLSKRPMKRVSDPLEQMGAAFTTTNGCLPMRIEHGVTRPLENYRLPVASAQVKSALLLAGLVSGQAVTIHEPELSRDHTERWLIRLCPGHFSIKNPDTPERTLLLASGAVLPSGIGDYRVPADPSSAAFWCVLAALTPGASLELRNVLLNPTRTGFVPVLQRAGVDIHLHPDLCPPGEEPVGRITVKGGADLKPFSIDPAEVPAMIDEAPILMALAAAIPGVSVIRGAEELRKKESDRITAVAGNLRRTGVTVEEFPDGMAVTGSDHLVPGGLIETHGDHRLAMAFLVLGAARCPGLQIDDVACAAVSYPTFLSELPLKGNA